MVFEAKLGAVLRGFKFLNFKAKFVLDPWLEGKVSQIRTKSYVFITDESIEYVSWCFLSLWLARHVM